MSYEWILQASGWLVGLSLVTFLVGITLVPIVVTRMPADFFIQEESTKWHFPHSPLGWSVWIVRNVVGACLILAGAVMLVTPGQGILTIAAGLLATTLPGKRRFVLWLVHFGGIQHTLNWIRKKAHQPPLLFPHHDGGKAA